jgi:hypothetical protein
MPIEAPHESKPPRNAEGESWDLQFDCEPEPKESDAFVPVRPIGMDGR